MTRFVSSLFVTLPLLFSLGCGPAIVHAPADMGDVARVRLAPENLGFEVEMPAESHPETERERIDGFDEPVVSSEWQVRTADQTAIFSVTHAQYPAGFTSNPRVVARMLDYVPEHLAESLHGRIASKSNLRASGGVRGVSFRVTAPDRSTIEGRFLIKGDVGLLAFFGASPGTRWRDAGQRMLRSLRFL